MKETLVIDASVAVKWVISEPGGAEAVALRGRFHFAAPELILAECANILWKKAQRGELKEVEATLAARLLENSGIAFAPILGLSEAAASLAIQLRHPAYDCVYLALASRRRMRFVTADRKLMAAVKSRAAPDLAALCFELGAL